VGKAKFVYVVYIETTPEKAWDALLEGDLTRQYWLHDNVSDWRVGSRWEHRRSVGKPQADLVGRVVEVAPPGRLVLTWAFPQDEDQPSRHTRVAFEIEKVESLVRLTVTHDDLEPGSEMERGITMGWPRVLSSMKTLLETGRPLDTWAGLPRL
jgi:uncharacterized protein YndB with AHSA1/START domain